MRERFGLIIKGIWIGATLTVPGVSGGSMAMILGIYEKLIASVNALFDRTADRKNAMKFLLVFGLSSLVGIFTFSALVVWALENFTSSVLFLFAGIVAGGIPKMVSEIKRELFRWYHAFLLIAGIMGVIALSYLPSDLFELGFTHGFIGGAMQVLGGIIAALALVLPGISVSHMLYVLGIYKSIMLAFHQLDLIKLLPFAIGLLFGILLSVRAMKVLIVRYHATTYTLIIGFVLGSVFELLNDVSVEEFNLWCLILFFAGLFCMNLIFNKRRGL